MRKNAAANQGPGHSTRVEKGLDQPHPNGHIQAVGTDVAGRRQYLYHQAWHEERAEEKFDRVLDLSLQLPEWRSRIAEDLAGRGGLRRDRVLALALHLLDRATSAPEASSTPRRTSPTAWRPCSAST